MSLNEPELLKKAKNGVEQFLRSALDEGRIDRQLHDAAIASTMPNLEQWLTSSTLDAISPNARNGIAQTIESGDKWEAIVNAFRQNLSFGTGGIRGMMAFDFASIKRLKEEGIDAPILKGPNTINNIVLLRVSAGVAKFGLSKGYSKIVIGYDSRIRGRDFATVIAELFLEHGYTVYLFDEPCPYPEVTFAIPYKEIQSDLGILISASHNDYRYNGYKLSCCNGSQFDPEQRGEMYRDYILKATFEDIKTCSLADAKEGKLIYLGGEEPLPEKDYHGCPVVNIHDRHRDHILGLLVNAERLRKQNSDPETSIKIGFCAYHGAGIKAVPRLLSSVGFQHIKPIHKNGLNELNGLFPSFAARPGEELDLKPGEEPEPKPGEERQPDPGDPQAAKTAIQAFKKEYPGEFEKTDILIGTDPDADRCGVVVKVPKEQHHLYDGDDFMLLPADDMWALIVWFRLHSEIEQHGKVVDADTKFIVQSLPTTDAIARVAVKYGLGVVKTWVGFANLAAATRMVWEKEAIPELTEGRTDPSEIECHRFIFETEGMGNGKRSFNYAAMEQSNGWSILGNPPPNERSLGEGGHVRDKDGTFAAILVAEIAAYAKANNTTIYEMVDKHIYLDPDIGLYVNRYEPDPLIGEYPGIQGDRKKKNILRRALALFQLAKAGDLAIGGSKVVDASYYRTGNYDHVYPRNYDFLFPDEGIRFYFNADRQSWLLVRPSGTGNSLRFHVQFHADVNESNLIDQKQELKQKADNVLDDLREILKAPRNT